MEIVSKIFEHDNNLIEICSMLMNLSAKHGKTFKIYLGMQPKIVTSDLNLVEHILTSNAALIDKSIDYKLFESIMGDGLLFSSGAKWRKRRKVFTPCFHYKILEEFVNVFESKGHYLVKNLQKHVGKNSFDVHETIGLYTLDVIVETAMGTNIDAQINPDVEYVKYMKRGCELAFKKCVLPKNKLIHKLSRIAADEEEIFGYINRFSDTIIAKRRETLINADMSLSEDDLGIKNKNTFLDVLLLSEIDGKPLSNADISEEVFIFIFEGHDTTAIGISACMYYIGMDPEVQANIVKELKTIFADDWNRTATMNDLNRMKYLEMVIKESLRLAPSVGIFARNIKEAFEFEGKHFPKDITLSIIPFALHKDPEIYPDPEKFDPERFTIEETSKRHPFAYIPFSAGPRNCIGQKFAMLELKSALAKILRRFEIHPAIPESKPIYTLYVTLKSSNGFCVRLENRNIN